MNNLSRPVDGKRWLIGNGGTILSSSSIVEIIENEQTHELGNVVDSDISNDPRDHSGNQRHDHDCPPLYRFPPSSFTPLATDDYFVVGFSESDKRFVVLDYLDVDPPGPEQEEEEKRRREREAAAAGRGGWGDLLSRVKKLKEGILVV